MLEVELGPEGNRGYMLMVELGQGVAMLHMPSAR